MSSATLDGRADGQPAAVGFKKNRAVLVRAHQAGSCLTVALQNGGMGKAIAVLPPRRNYADAGLNGVDETRRAR